MTAIGAALERARARLLALAPELPDGRLAVAELELAESAEGVSLVGAATDPALPPRVLAELRSVAPELTILDRVRRLPSPAALGGKPRAVVAAAWVPARRAPSHRAEMVTQWLCGEVLEVLERRGAWRRARGRDGYLGWAAGGGVADATMEDAGRWSAAARAICLGTALLPVDDRPPPGALPWGSRIAAGADGTVRLPDGGRARPADPAAIVADERSERFPRDGAAVLDTALRWLGAPYVWGGRTPWGSDCSGFVQSVFELHGVPLPRDSDLQRETGRDLGWRPGQRIDFRPGDLLFFAPGGGRVAHVGIAAGGTRLVHCSDANGVLAFDDLAGSRPLERELRESLVAATRPVEPPPSVVTVP